MASKKMSVFTRLIFSFFGLFILSLAYTYFNGTLQSAIDSHIIFGFCIFLVLSCVYAAVVCRILFTKPWGRRTRFHKSITVIISCVTLALLTYAFTTEYLDRNISKPYMTLDQKTFNYEMQLSSQADEYSDTLKSIVGSYHTKEGGYLGEHINRKTLLKIAAKKEKVYLKFVQTGLGHYGSVIDSKIMAYIISVKKVHNEVISGSKKSIIGVYDIYEGQNKLSKVINMKLIGCPDDDSAKNAYIMSIVPKAIQQLKKHPNDRKLCTVMLLPMTGDHIYQDSDKLAFMKVGNKYCNNFYDLRSSWGQLGSGNDRYESKYSQLSYQVYFDRYVKPLIPKETKRLEKHPENVCQYHAFNDGERNPELDAMRQAYLMKGKEYCSKSSLKPRYFSTGYFCLIMGGFPSSKILDTDLVEQCKETPGVLFSYSRKG